MAEAAVESTNSPERFEIDFKVDPKAFRDITAKLNAESIKIIHSKPPGMRRTVRGFFYCLVEHCGEHGNTGGLKEIIEKDDHLKTKHEILPGQATEIHVKIIRQWRTEVQILRKRYAIEVIHLWDLAEKLTEGAAQYAEKTGKSSNKLECVICLIDGCGFCKCVTELDGVPKEASKHLRFHSNLPVIHYFDFTLLVKGQAPGRAIIPVKIDIDKSKLTLVREILFTIYADSYKCFIGRQDPFQNISKYDKKGWYFCLLTHCSAYPNLMKLSRQKKHLKDYHPGLDKTFTIEIQVCLIRKEESTPTEKGKITTSILCEFANTLEEIMSNLPSQLKAQSYRLSCFICLPGCNECICVVGYSVEKEIKKHLHDAHLEYEEKLYKDIIRIILMLNRRQLKGFYYPSQKKAELAEQTGGLVQEMAVATEHTPSLSVIPIEERGIQALSSTMKSLASYSSQMARTTPKLKKNVGKGWYLCLLDHCADNVYGNRLLFEFEKAGHFRTSHETLVPMNRVAIVSVRVIQEYEAKGHFGPINAWYLEKRFAAKVIDKVSQKTTTLAENYACFLCLLPNCGLCMGFVEESSFAYETKKHLRGFHKMNAKETGKKSICFFNINLIVKQGQLYP